MRRRARGPLRSFGPGTGSGDHLGALGPLLLLLMLPLSAPGAPPGAAASADRATGAERAQDAGDDSNAAADWVARMDRALLPGGSMVARARIETHDGFGGRSVDTIDIARVSEDGTTRTLIEVEAPEAREGVAYEIVAPPDAPLHRWVWLPEVGRLREIVGVRRTDPFLGSEFTYEDLGLATPRERREGVVRHIVADGEPTIELESPSYHYYARVVTRLDPHTGLPRRVRFYDRAGQLFREQRFEAVETIDGASFPTRIVVRDALTGARSLLVFDAVRLGVEVPAARFADSAVRRRLRLAGERDVVPDVAAERRPDARAD